MDVIQRSGVFVYNSLHRLIKSPDFTETAQITLPLACRAMLASNLANAYFNCIAACFGGFTPFNNNTADWVAWFIVLIAHFIIGLDFPLWTSPLSLVGYVVSIHEDIATKQRFDAWLNGTICDGYLEVVNCPKEIVPSGYYLELVVEAAKYLFAICTLRCVIWALDRSASNNQPLPPQPQPPPPFWCTSLVQGPPAQVAAIVNNPANHITIGGESDVSDWEDETSSDDDISEQDGDVSEDENYVDVADDDLSEDDTSEIDEGEVNDLMYDAFEGGISTLETKEKSILMDDASEDDDDVDIALLRLTKQQ